MKTVTITYNQIKEEVINRQKKFGKGDPDICCDKKFNGLTLKYMIVLLLYWPKCEDCEDYCEIEIEITEEEEIPFALFCTATTMLGREPGKE